MIDVRISAGAVPDFQIGWLGCDVQEWDGDLQDKVDVRILVAEQFQFGHQELPGESWGHRDPQSRGRGFSIFDRHLL
ncbi:hypothetical protein D3C81_1212600 [compost metagenome]